MEKINAMIKAADESGDEQFFSELKAIVNAGDGKPDANAIIKFAATRGYDISEADWNEYYEQDQKAKRATLGKTKELSEEELETVAGGGGYKHSHRCFLVTGAWTADKTHVHCLRLSCSYWEFGGDLVDCHCYSGSSACDFAASKHKLSVLDKNGKCPHQDGYIGGPPPAGSM